MFYPPSHEEEEQKKKEEEKEREKLTMSILFANVNHLLRSSEAGVGWP